MRDARAFPLLWNSKLNRVATIGSFLMSFGMRVDPLCWKLPCFSTNCTRCFHRLSSLRPEVLQMAASGDVSVSGYVSSIALHSSSKNRLKKFLLTVSCSLSTVMVGTFVVFMFVTVMFGDQYNCGHYRYSWIGARLALVSGWVITSCGEST